MLDYLSQPWPWRIAGPMISLVVFLLLLVGNKRLGMSSPMKTLRSLIGAKHYSSYFDTRRQEAARNIFFVIGVFLGGRLSARYLMEGHTLDLSAQAQALFTSRGMQRDAYLPDNLFGIVGMDLVQFLFLLLGGALVGFGARLGEGCTSGHAIMGIADLQWPSLLGVIGFFVGGLFMSWLLLPYILPLLG